MGTNDERPVDGAECVTIGVFARLVGLSPKALRLYDDLGLLTPARVDPVSGYRLYRPDQVGRARLVAWLRRLGMPLARIRDVGELSPTEAADAVRVYWRGVEHDTAARRQLAALLIDELSRRDTTMVDDKVSGAPPKETELVVRYAARSDRGVVRENNQDAVYAGSNLFAVADGFGADVDGRSVSASVLSALEPLDADVPAGNLLNVLDDAIRGAEMAVREFARPADSGTTLTALLRSGSRLALVHVGDSRVYVLRSSELLQITHDHTYVRALMDEGRLTAEEAASHPQRSLLTRALDGVQRADLDVQLREARAGDRYLLCSDGLHAVVTSEEIRATLTATIGDPDAAVERLVESANTRGGPDNIACVVADVEEVTTAVAR